MQNIYNASSILEILKTFNVKQIVISGIKDFNLINTILSYNIPNIQINTNNENSFNENPLKVLPKLKNYDAVFIDDDPNWFTVFNELNIIKKENVEFPLVIICNNNFPNKRRDSYSNPNSIPKEFRHNYTTDIPICFNDKKINITDGFYHACDENTPKNGVLTAIEDFIKNNSHIGLFKINIPKEICILYPKSQINQKRVSIITKKIENQKMNTVKLSDKIIENHLLIDYINKYNLYDENLNKYESEITKKNSIINEYENEIIIQNNEIRFKDGKISNFESNLSLKESQLKNIESKLVNSDKKITILKNQLKNAHNNLNELSTEMNNKNNQIDSLEKQLKTTNENYDSLTNQMENTHIKINDLIDDFEQLESYYSDKITQKEESLKENEKNHLKQINSLKKDLKYQDAKIKIQNQELKENEKKLNSVQRSYVKQYSNIVNKDYCINCFKEEISNNHLEIEYLKSNILLKRILSPISYLYLILKSNPKEILLNIKLYQSMKDSECFDIGFYLNNNKDLIESKWCKYLSPELHYVCNGFNEKRTFNKKYFNRNSKKELLNYILTCNK